MHLTQLPCNGIFALVVRLQFAADRDDMPRNTAAATIKATALRLFAERGVDGVTVREIATAAGQKNHGAVGYYFGSKEALVRQLVQDGAILIDRRRHTRLDALESAGGPTSVRDIVDVLIFPSFLAEGDEDEHYIRFVVMLSMTHRELLMDALENRWNAGYQRCLDHLRNLMPPMPRVLQNQRFVFMGAYLGSVLARREQALADHSRAHPIWGADYSLEHFARSLTTVLEARFDLPVDPAPAGDERLHAHTGPVG